MSREIHRLSAPQVSKSKKPGLYADGGGLYLQISKSGARSWLFRYMLAGRSREMGLGPLRIVSLAEAREKAAHCRKLLQGKIDPIEARDSKRGHEALEAAKAVTFAECAQAYIDSHRAGWKNAKHAAQWETTLKTYVYPVFEKMPVQGIDTTLVLKVLEPIWTTKAETASRVRGRIESVLDWARVRGYRTGDNPARWRGHLAELLPPRSKVQTVQHHPALPYAEMAEFIAELRKPRGVAALALEFLILTAARTGEVIGAKPGEFDHKEKIWTVPAERMKAKREHRVPLSPRAFKILEEVLTGNGGSYVFPGARSKSPLSSMAMLALLERMGRPELTVHGFRSSFSDWAAERTNFPSEVREMALAHRIPDKAEAAYRRGDLFEKRRRLMTEWQRYCERKPGAVVSIAAAGR